MYKHEMNTRGLRDNHSPRNHVSDSKPASYLSSDVLTAYPYKPRRGGEESATPDEETPAVDNGKKHAIVSAAPSQNRTKPSRPDLKLEAIDNDNEGDGKQTIGEIEIGKSSKGYISPIFTEESKVDVKAGNNKNKGKGTQTVGKITIG